MGIGENSGWAQDTEEDEEKDGSSKDYVSRPAFVGGLGEFKVVRAACGLSNSLAVVEKVGNPNALAPSIISTVLSATASTSGSAMSGSGSGSAASAGCEDVYAAVGLESSPADASLAVAAASLARGVQLGPDEGSPYVSSTRLGDETMMAPVVLSQESLMDSGLALPSSAAILSSSPALAGDDGDEYNDAGEFGGENGGYLEGGGGDMDDDKSSRLKNNKFLSKL